MQCGDVALSLEWLIETIDRMVETCVASNLAVQLHMSVASWHIISVF